MEVKLHFVHPNLTIDQSTDLASRHICPCDVKYMETRMRDAKTAEIGQFTFMERIKSDKHEFKFY